MRTTTVVIGAGHGGLAMSRCLSDRSIDHVVLERSEVANSWRTERWDSLRLLTPNWQCRLPGYAYEGDDPDGFMTMPEVVDFITGYAKDIARPVQTGTTVTSVRRTDDGYRVTTDQDEWQCPTVVLATGAFNVPRPDFADAVPPSVTTLTPMEYRNPDELAEGGVLVVGASATGVQIAHEIQRSGRPVTLAVGEHVGGPRRYRGRDIHWWMEAAGVLDERYDEVDDIVRAAACRRCSSPDRPSGPRSTSTRSRHRCDAGRPPRRHPRRPCPVLRVVAEQVRPRRPQAQPAARHHRRVGDGQRHGRRDPPPHRFAPTVVPEPPALDLDLAEGRDPDDHLGDRLPPRLLLARRRRPRRQGHGPARRWCRRLARGCT